MLRVCPLPFGGDSVWTLDVSLSVLCIYTAGISAFSSLHLFGLSGQMARHFLKFISHVDMFMMWFKH